MKAKISLITLGVRDLGAALAFYRDGLGFKTHNHKPGDDCIFFALKGAWLAALPARLARAGRPSLARGLGVQRRHLGP